MPDIVYVKPGGWLHLHEDRARLESYSMPIPFSGIGEIPATVDPTSWIIVEDQQNQGACAGHSLTTGMECLLSKHGFAVDQLSRACAYYMTQRIDGIRGDSGSTIEGGCRLAEGDGVCFEPKWPYPSRYDPTIPAGYEGFPKVRIKGHRMLKTYEQCLEHLAIGPIHPGIIWSDDIDRQVAQNGIIKSYSPGRGGHSTAWVGYRVTDWLENPLPGDLPYLIKINSWPKWGYKGAALISPQAISQMLEERFTVVTGLVGCMAPEPVMPVYM